MNEVKLDYLQERALQVMLSGENVFVGGNGGTGKSVLIKSFMARHECGNTALLGPTGIAALQVGGSTIHSFFKFPPTPISEEIIYQMGESTKLKLTAVQTLVIDEISMVSSNLFWAMDFALKKATGKWHSPFGGKQIILVGDFAQLPPVIPQRDIQNFMLVKHGGIYAFQTLEWDKANLHFVELSQSHRQTDLEFQNVLDVIRSQACGDITMLNTALSLINSHCLAPVESKRSNGITLCARNKKAELINNIKLAALRTRKTAFMADVRGAFAMEERPTNTELQIKIGAKVMFLANELMREESAKYVNGDLGTVVDFTNTLENKEVSVKIERTGRIVRIMQHSWQAFEYEVSQGQDGPILQRKIVGEFIQIPLKLAYAVTIHKAQGATIERGRLQLGDGYCFAPGMLYVALSRFRSFESFTLDRLLMIGDVRTDGDVFDFYNNLDLQYGYGSMRRSFMRFSKLDAYQPIRFPPTL